MASALTGPLLGGPVLADVAGRLAAAGDAYAAASGGAYAASYDNASALAPAVPRLLLLSAHYNVLMSLLAALRLDVLLAPADAATVPWLTAMPAAAAVLVFELHADASSGALAVRAVAQDGPAANYSIVPMPCASAAASAVAGPGACTLADFQALAAPAAAAAGTPAAWCSACSNANALPCVAAAAGASKRAHGDGSRHAVALGVGLGVGLGGFALVAAVAVLALRIRRQRTRAGAGGDIRADGVGLRTRGDSVVQHSRLQDCA